jgi:hypothetical protein
LGNLSEWRRRLVVVFRGVMVLSPLEKSPLLIAKKWQTFGQSRISPGAKNVMALTSLESPRSAPSSTAAACTTASADSSDRTAKTFRACERAIGSHRAAAILPRPLIVEE